MEIIKINNNEINQLNYQILTMPRGKQTKANKHNNNNKVINKRMDYIKRN